MAVHRPAHHHTVAADFIENDVLLERTEHDKGTPVPQARMNEVATRPKLRVLAEELTGGFHCGEVMFRHLPTCVD